MDKELEAAVLALTDTSSKYIVKAALLKVRKKPVVVTAVRWEPEKDAQITRDGFIDYSSLIDGYNQDHTKAFIYTLEGRMEGSSGDWIIVGVKGERYFCKNDVFLQTYDRGDAYE